MQSECNGTPTPSRRQLSSPRRWDVYDQPHHARPIVTEHAALEIHNLLHDGSLKLARLAKGNIEIASSKSSADGILNEGFMVRAPCAP